MALFLGCLPATSKSVQTDVTSRSFTQREHGRKVQMDRRKADFMPQKLKYWLRTGGQDHEQTQLSLHEASRDGSHFSSQENND